MKHILLENPNTIGFEYGSLKSFEEAIITNLKAEIVHYPQQKNFNKFPQATNKFRLRAFLPKTKIETNGDVLWIVLMGPEEYNLDLLKGWKNKNILKIVYLFDTLPHQFKLIQRLFSNNDIDILITSFNDAIQYLEKLTNRKWHYIPQGIPDFFFPDTSENFRNIAFSSYGRRLDKIHEIIKVFCFEKSLHYDYSTSKGIQKGIMPIEAYKQYAWHLKHSIFNISWSVNITNPQRSKFLNPITARWFENASSGVTTIGLPPNNTVFADELFPEMVINLDPNKNKLELIKDIESLWEQREMLMNKSTQQSLENRNKWNWNNRISKINSIIFNSKL